MIHLLPDLIILLIAVLSVLVAWKRGFVKTFISAVSVLVALILTFLLTGPVTSLLEQTGMSDAVRGRIEQTLDDLATENADGDAKQLASDPESPLTPLLGSVGIDGAEFDQWLSEKQQLSKAAFREALVTYVAAPVTRLLLSALSALALFIGSMLLLKLAAFLLSGVIEQIPFLRGANHALGIVLGCVLALLRILIFCFVLRALMNASVLASVPFFSAIDPDKTFLFRFLTDSVLFRFFL